MNLPARLEALTGIPAQKWEAWNDEEPHAVFAGDGRNYWRVERVSEEPEMWEAEVRPIGGKRRTWTAGTMEDAVKLAVEGATP